MSNTCVIVGAGPGMGLSLAKTFAKEGFRLALIARRADALSRYVKEITHAGYEARGFAADIGDFAALRGALEQIQEQMGDPEVLIYNAAALKLGLLSRLSPHELADDFRVNVAAALLCVQKVLPPMRVKRRGTILLTGGGFALNPVPQFASMAVGKAALRNLSFGLAEELADDGIHVATVTICGFIKEGTHFDPDQIAEAYVRLHRQPRERWEREVMFT